MSGSSKKAGFCKLTTKKGSGLVKEFVKGGGSGSSKRQVLGIFKLTSKREPGGIKLKVKRNGHNE